MFLTLLQCEQIDQQLNDVRLYGILSTTQRAQRENQLYRHRWAWSPTARPVVLHSIADPLGHPILDPDEAGQGLARY